MEFARVLRELSKRRLLLALGVLVAVAVSMFSVYRLEGGKLKARTLQYSAATTQVLVDSGSSLLGSVSPALEPLSARAQLYANFMASPALLEVIAKQVGLSGDQLAAAGPVDAQLPRVEQEPTAFKRNVELTGETKPYRLNYEAQGNLPTITIYSQAPTTSVAVGLANAAASGLAQYVASVQSKAKISPATKIEIRQLGPATGAVVDGGIKKTLALMVFVGVFLLWCVLMLIAVRFRETWRQSAALEREWDEDWDKSIEPAADGRDASEVVPRRHAHNPVSAPLYGRSGSGDDRPAAVSVQNIR